MTYATIPVDLEASRSNANLLRVAEYVADRFQAGMIGATACAPIQMIYGDGDIFEQDRKGGCTAFGDARPSLLSH